MNYKLLFAFAGALMLGACSSQDDEGQATSAQGAADEGEVGDWEASGSVEKASSGKVVDSGLGYEYVVVDHSKDVEEFELRKSIGGVESLIEHYKENGWDTSELEAQLEELQQELANLVE